MANSFVLVTHAEFARGILSSLRLVLGDANSAAVVSVTTSETVDAIAKRIEQAIDSVSSSGPVVVVTDIPGGSTTQATIQVAPRRPDAYYVVGLNLGLLLELALLPLGGPSRRESDLALIRNAVEASKRGIGVLADLVDDDAEDSDDLESDEL
ncbi:hypothetical protein [uncultured Parolsenella sp.]|uniref:PTS sugar transporter subunit IIA domain-containing protein n=1 Tax=uncultured Parolsenella sp. TaxID=2083008 RepID=UPI0027D9AF67|nr:hypothetical protein [uncultured Parolsenella sp.]